jgi:hypothetical protein
MGMIGVLRMIGIIGLTGGLGITGMIGCTGGRGLHYPIATPCTKKCELQCERIRGTREYRYREYRC